MPRASALAPLLALTSLSWTTRAVAQPWVLTWRAPPECPSEETVRAQVASLLRDSTHAEGASMTVTVARGPRWRASIVTQTTERRGARDLEAATCAELGDAAAVILAWMIDPDVAARADTSPPPSTSTPPPASASPEAPALPLAPPSSPPPPAPPPPPPPTPSTSPPPAPAAPSARWSVHVGLAARGDLGALPGFTVGPELRVTVAREAWRVSVEGSWRPTAVTSLLVGRGGRFDLWTVGLRGCHVWRPTAVLSPGACGFVEGGRVTAEGVGADRTWTIAEPWLATGAGASLDLRLTPWLFGVVAADLLVPLVRPDYVLEPDRAVFQSAPAGLRARIGVEAHF